MPATQPPRPDRPAPRGTQDPAAILDAVAGLVLTIEADGRIAFASAGARALLGADPAALVGRPLAALVGPADAAGLGACPDGPVALALHDAAGRSVAVEACARPLPGGARAVTIRRLPERRDPPDAGESLAALRMGRDHYRALADSLPQLIWMERADTGETLYVNEAFTAYCGPIPPTRAARIARFHPEDAPRIAAACTGAASGTREIQGRIRDRSGHHRWHQLVLRPLCKEERLLGWLGSALDIDETVRARRALKETGDLLRLAQDAAGAGLFDADLAPGTLTLSPESAGRHGLPGDRPAVIGLADWLRRLLPADRAPTLRAIREAVRAERTFDVAFRVPAGALPAGAQAGPTGTGLRHRWIQAIGRTCRTGGEGGAPRLTGLTLDITARKDAERALVEAKAAAEAARAQAERASAAKTDFLSAMSHEIRTPLSAVIGFSELLAGSDRLDGDLRRYADLARAAGASLRTVVDDILDFAAVEAGTITLCPEPFRVRDLVERCLGIVGTAAAAKGLETAFRVEPEVPDDLVGDVGRLRQILLNLLTNAVKFTARGGVTVAVSREGWAAGGERLRFSVTDTGIGIAPEHQGRLFERFVQADHSIRRDFGGTGLGLAISRRLVERMGGTIGLVSRPGQGATFAFALMLPRAPAAAPEAPERPASAARTGKILLVEDIEVNRELAATVLRAAGHAVTVAADGIAAVRAVESETFDLVLMDIQMPGIDGLTATRLIRCMPGAAARVPVVAMSANVLPAQVRAFREAGLDGQIAKPFRPAELHAAVDRWLGGSPDRDALPAPTRGGPGGKDLDGGGAEIPEPALDRARHADTLGMLAPETLGRLLRQFHARVAGAFDPAAPAGAASLRAEAHALTAAAGLLGFLPLSRACAALETAAPDDVPAALARARRLAGDAAAAARALLAGDAPEALRAGARS